MTILTEAVKLLRSTGKTNDDIYAMFNAAISSDPFVSFPSTTAPTNTTSVTDKIMGLLATHGDRMVEKQRNLCLGIADFSRNRPLSPAQLSTINNVSLGITGSKIL